MKRINLTPRHNWEKAVEQLGFGFHSTNVPYWDESACYSFSMEQVLQIEAATQELWEMCLNAVQFVIDNGQYKQFHIPEWFVPQIERSWNEDHPSIYGRFDLVYKDGRLKLLEFNADTPTSLYEAGIVQWYWLQDFDASKDQFNSIHEKLVDYWSYLKQYLYAAPLHFSCVKRNLEDLTTTEYLRDCAIQAGIDTRLIFMDDIGWDAEKKEFLDMEEQSIRNIFKLYPYEWIVADPFGKHITEDRNKALWIEPAWRMILSSKAILPVLWHLYPNHPYLLKAYFDQGDLTDYVKKPIWSREGANIEIVTQGKTLQQTGGDYGAEGFVYQEFCPLPEYSGNFAVLGSWVIGQQAAGMGIRESSSLVTDNTSRFVPHLIQ